MEGLSHKRSFWWIIALSSLLLFLIQASFLGDWLVDDAGISIAYAQNWTEGNGLVDQSGKSPVEGFSNFLWVSILAITQKMGVFSIPFTPKLLGILFCVFSIFLLNQHGNTFSAPILGVILILLIPTHPSIVQWSVSGLETGLYFFLLLVHIHLLSQSTFSEKIALLLGLIVGLISLTRPEGILLITASPILLLGQQDYGKKILLYLIPIIIILGGYELFRLSYFQDILPNTFYAKGLQNMENGTPWLKLHHLAKGIFGPLGMGGLIMLSALLIWLRKKNLWNRQLKTLLLLTIIGAIQFLLMPYDHLDWYRYATLFIVAGIWLGLLSLDLFLQTAPFLTNRKPIVNSLLIAGAIAYLLFSFSLSWERSKEPVVPLQKIMGRAELVKEVALRYDIQSPTVLTPDAGGFLLAGELTVYDLPGLCNKKLALTYGKDQGAFENYIFEDLQPDIITLHGLWTDESGLLKNEQFQATYSLIYSEPESTLLIFVRN
ncbi:MAG: hypothetical protein AAFR66_22310 [Bacteroidota bacterium]